MSYTYPAGQPQGMPLQFTNILREILIAEIIAINGYQQHIVNSDMEDVNRVWQKIMLDEKKHFGWILGLLRKYDPEEYRQYLAVQAAKTTPNSPMQAYRPVYGRHIVLNNLRSDIKGELESVILYEEELRRFPYQDIRTALQSIISEEKGHAEHLAMTLFKYDPDPYDNLGE